MRRRGRLVEEPQQFPFPKCLKRSFVRLLPGRLVGVGLAQFDLSKTFERLGGIPVAYQLSFQAAARFWPVTWQQAAGPVCPPTRATGHTYRWGPPLPRHGKRADPLRPGRTVEIPAELLRAVTLRDKRGGVG